MGARDLVGDGPPALRLLEGVNGGAREVEARPEVQDTPCFSLVGRADGERRDRNHLVHVVEVQEPAYKEEHKSVSGGGVSVFFS